MLTDLDRLHEYLGISPTSTCVIVSGHVPYGSCELRTRWEDGRKSGPARRWNQVGKMEMEWTHMEVPSENDMLDDRLGVARPS